jgi:predicted RNase H-like HicB family nuclease
MITEYIKTAMGLAQYEYVVEDDGQDPYVFAHIPALKGLSAHADTYQQAQAELQEALEGWLLVGLQFGHPIPVLAEIDLNPHHPTLEVA